MDARNMKEAEVNIQNVYMECRASGIFRTIDLLKSKYKDTYIRCMLDFIYFTLFSSSNKGAVHTLKEEAKNIASDVCGIIIFPNLYNKNERRAEESFDTSFIITEESELIKFLTDIIHKRLIDILRKEKRQPLLEFEDGTIIEDPYNMIDHTEEDMTVTEHIDKIFKITNLFGAFCFLCVRYFSSYKPRELAAILQEEVTEIKSFPQVAATILERHGYHLDLNSVADSSTGYTKNSADAKVISDAARCVANTLKNHLEEFGVLRTPE